jgi:excinuclease ABC subunit C
MQVALKIMRRIFPFHSLAQKTEKGCLDFQMGLCPGPYTGAISKKEYARNIHGIRMILEGKKKNLIKKLEMDMQAFAKKSEFEKAAELRNKIFALRHIQDVALIGRDDENFEFRISNFESNHNFKNSNLKIESKVKSQKSKVFRVEAYDISNISGQYAVGSMVVFTNNQQDKAQYRKFKIKTVISSDDVAMMREVLSRRFHNIWSIPDLILLDGGMGHLNMAEKLLREKMGLDVVIAGVAKGPSRKNVKIQMINDKLNPNIKISNEINNILADKNLVKYIMDEAHRFAITYHRKLRSKNALND